MAKHGFLKRLIWAMVTMAMTLLVLFVCLLIALEFDLPNVETLKDVHLQEPLRIFTSDNKLIAEFGEIKRVPVTLNQIPQTIVQATLATEDQRFFSHPGVDFFGLARAGIVLVATGQKKEGGSTITMQVARNFFLTRKKTYYRKMKEILLALKIDHEFSKQKILELYFNKTFYGNRAYGIAAAAQIYYGKNLDALTLPEIATLVGIPKAPSALNPIANPTAAMDRRNHVLQRMLDLHYIDQKTYEEAISTPNTAKLHELQVSVTAPYVAEMVRQLMIDQFGDSTYNQGYDVYTTINSNLQQAANRALSQALLAYDKRHGYRGPLSNLGRPNMDDLNSWVNALNKMPTIDRLQPAAVLGLQGETASVLLKTGAIVTLSWNGMQWARWQMMNNDQESLGPSPKKASDILKIGDLIYVTQNLDQSWSLDQIPQAEAALISLDPKDGRVLALTGGFNYYKSNFNRVTQAERQPGSSFKPFLYSAALDKGFTLATIVNDAPIAISDSGSADTVWRPENDTQNFYGPIRLRTALIKSRNLASIRVLQLIGVPYAVDYISRFGFTQDQLPQSLSLALGTASVTPLQMAQAYAVFANGGYLVKPYFVSQIINNQNKLIYEANPIEAGNPSETQQPTNKDQPIAPRVITPQNAYLMNSALRDVIQHGTGRPALILNRPDLAGKTGTTNNQYDAWFCGFNTNLVAIAWMGFDQQRSLYEYAVRSALPLWIGFMKQAMEGQPEAALPQPDDIVTVRIDRKSGLLARANDPDAMFEVFTKETVPTQKDTGQTPSSSDTDNNSEQPDINQLY